ncbi:MAG TPA: hypothetical protein PK878_11590 [bacterium]|nr:hypothetical protein [bacterium]HOL94487.1 hypothetical protein [bacterium]HPO99663.1 hypothetical protein [bacterium]
MLKKMVCILVSAMVFNLGTFAAETPAKIETVEQALAWLKSTSTRMIQESRRAMADGTAAFPPQVGPGYEAFWLRDYAYMLEGNPGAFENQDLLNACRLFVQSIREDGAGVDCVKFDGTPIYKPGMGSMGENPVADGSQFTIKVAWLTYQKTGDKELILEIIGRLVSCLKACPRHPESGLVYIDPAREYDRCPYGFTDTVRMKGETLFCSLLFVEAARELADLLRVVERHEEAEEWLAESRRVAAQIRLVFWDDAIGLFRAATVQCKEPDIWGSAYAVYTGVAGAEQSKRVAAYLADHYSELTQHGQVRHTPAGVYWETAGPRDEYQNGGYWATPAGWFAYTLNLADPGQADRMIIELVNDLQKRHCPEWIFNNRTQLPGYNASASLPIAGIEKMLRYREAQAGKAGIPEIHH